MGSACVASTGSPHRLHRYVVPRPAALMPVALRAFNRRMSPIMPRMDDRSSTRHDGIMNDDDDLRFRVSHPDAPRINRPDDVKAPRTRPVVERPPHVAELRRALRDAATPHRCRPATEAGIKALEYDSAEAVRMYLAAIDVVLPARWSVSYLTPEPMIEVGGLRLSVSQFAMAIESHRIGGKATLISVDGEPVDA